MSDDGRFGLFGGRYMPEILMEAVIELETGYYRLRDDPAFRNELGRWLREYAGRPTPLTFAPHLSADLGCKVYLKREDLLHGGAHKLNNTLGQALLARHLGKTRLIAETGAGQHGVATAIVGAALGMPVEIYMGGLDIARQRLNVLRMELLGATVHAVESGTRTLKDAINEALRDWAGTSETTHYLLGTAAGPHPYPVMVRDFQSVIGTETRYQTVSAEGRLPDLLVACVGGGSNAIGLFAPFASDSSVRMVGVEAGGEGLDTGRHSATLSRGSPGVLHGTLSYLLQDAAGQVLETHSVAAGLDYPGVGPEHAHYHETGRVEYTTASDAEALEALAYLSRREGIIPALESAHAIAALRRLASTLDPDAVVVVCLSGRGDKDMHQLAERQGIVV
jgi:tryptophan synthase beta chain